MKSILSILVFIASISTAQADALDSFLTDQALPFVKEITLIDVKDQRPQIVFLSDAELQAQFQASVVQEFSPVSKVKAPEKRETRVEAFYNPDNRTIFLKDTWSILNVMDQVKLVHEFTHFAQQVSGQDKLYSMCQTAHSERQAWHVTMKWLRAVGYDKTNPGEFSKLQFTGLQQGTCMDPEAHP